MGLIADSTSQTPTHKRGYVWQAPGHAVSIEIDFDVVDRLGDEIARAAGGDRAGREIGGVLLGTVVPDETTRVRVEDYELVPVTYSSGPCYALGAGDHQRFADVRKRWSGSGRSRWRAVGFFRTHTRDDLGLDECDRDLLDRFFPEESAIALLVQTAAGQPDTARLLFREHGRFAFSETGREFPFRREDLGGGTVPPVEARGQVRSYPSFSDNDKETPVNATNETSATGTTGFHSRVEDAPPENGDGGRSSVPARTLKLRGGWVWLPLSFIFMLVGTILGFQVALSVESKIPASGEKDPYAMGLATAPSAGSVLLRWDQYAPPIWKAQRAVLTITEGDRQKSVALDAVQLRNGSVLYRRASNDVEFRLEVFLKNKVTVAEAVSYSAPGK